MFGDLKTADHKALNEDQEARLHNQLAVVVLDLTTQWIQSYLYKIKSAQETPRSLRQFICPEENPRYIKSEHSLDFLKLANGWFGILGDLHRIDPKEMELQSELHDEREKTLRQWFSLDFMLSSKRTSRWSDDFWTSVHFTIWRADYSVWSRSKILSDVINRPRLSGSVRHKSLFWKCSWDTLWTRRGSWTGDLSIVDTDDVKTMPPSAILVK